MARHAGGAEFEMADGSDRFIRGKTHHGHARRTDTGGTELEKLATGYSHGHGYLLVVITDPVDCLAWLGVPLLRYRP
ncbi:H-X9-DG-CTERM domain-containing protein [Stutzerimonas stutzeri]|uniref:H-X9-DG-CTERM domain-containing protein n=1 Tax=Stutzerimonas stutzeri TaxID=316 RepID=UPI003C702688